MFESTTLRKMRCLSGVSQEQLAKQLKESCGIWRTQPAISRLEVGGHDPRLQEALSQSYRNLGLDADPDGAILYIPRQPR
jgi:predicted transcriptional regulator